MENNRNTVPGGPDIKFPSVSPRVEAQPGRLDRVLGSMERVAPVGQDEGASGPGSVPVSKSIFDQRPFRGRVVPFDEPDPGFPGSFTCRRIAPTRPLRLFEVGDDLRIAGVWDGGATTK